VDEDAVAAQALINYQRRKTFSNFTLQVF
jgi:hypothetical protein